MKRRFGSFFYKSKLQEENNPPPRRRRGNFATRFLRRACFIVGALVLFSIAMGVIVGMVFGKRSSSALPDSMILTFDLQDPLGETERARSFADPLSAAGSTVGDVIETLDRAAADKRVRGLLVSLDLATMELTHIQELRDAVKRFRLAGKFAHIYTPSFTDLGSGIGAYYFAAAFDEIWMQPIGSLSITGMSIEMPFAREALDKVGANPEFLHREEYKSAMESLTNTSISPANREMMTSILNDFSSQIFNDIVMDRELNADALRAQMDKGLLSGSEAVKAGLITRVDYADVLLDEVQETLAADGKGAKEAEDVPLVALEDYREATVRPAMTLSTANVALVRIAGEIVPGDEPEPGYANGDYIASAIEDATDAPKVKVIVLRIDSPGGSPSASETIRRAVIRAKDAGKKIVVSMGPLAASGGYWIAVDADRIFAMPTTLTGSIGVIMGKFELSGLWEKLGINWETLSWGQNAQMWSMNKPLSESEYAALDRSIDETYAAFIERVAQGRHLKTDEVRAVAKGRAWTGLQALENGLVDDIGGLDVAMDYAALLVGAKDRTGLKTILLPEPQSAFEQIMQLMGQGVLSGAGGAEIAGAKQIMPLLRQAQVMEKIGPVQAYDPRLNFTP